jgi:GNAT superfamily N-acetyltransferase
VEWTIRPARLEDADGVVQAHERASSRLFEQVVGKPLAELMPYDARLDSFRQSIAKVSPTARILVAESDGAIVGFCACVRTPEGAGEVKDLHVVPEAWGAGLATDLMAAATGALWEMGAAEAFLWVGEENPRARRFYEREGWAHDGSSQPSSLGPLELRYTKSLREAPPE